MTEGFKGWLKNHRGRPYEVELETNEYYFRKENLSKIPSEEVLATEFFWNKPKTKEESHIPKVNHDVETNSQLASERKKRLQALCKELENKVFNPILSKYEAVYKEEIAFNGTYNSLSNPDDWEKQRCDWVYDGLWDEDVKDVCGRAYKYMSKEAREKYGTSSDGIYDWYSEEIQPTSMKIIRALIDKINETEFKDFVVKAYHNYEKAITIKEKIL